LKEDIETRTEFTKKGAGRINTEVAVFAFFLFLSFVLWYLNSLGKETEAGIKYAVKFTNLPKERIIADNPPLWLNVYLKGKGSSILKLKFSGNKTPVNIDISKVNYKRVPGSRDLEYYIVSSGLNKSLTVQLRSGCEVTSIKPDTIFFTLEKAVSKTLKTGSNAK
jgi:hypothetical protein